MDGHQGGEEERDEARKLTQTWLDLNQLTCHHLVSHLLKSALLVLSLIWLPLLLAKPGPSRAAADGPRLLLTGRGHLDRPVVIPPPHTLRYAAVRGRGSDHALGTVVIMPPAPCL